MFTHLHELARSRRKLAWTLPVGVVAGITTLIGVDRVREVGWVGVAVPGSVYLGFLGLAAWLYERPNRQWQRRLSDRLGVGNDHGRLIGVSFSDGIATLGGETAWDRGRLRRSGDSLEFEGLSLHFALPRNLIVEVVPQDRINSGKASVVIYWRDPEGRLQAVQVLPLDPDRSVSLRVQEADLVGWLQGPTREVPSELTLPLPPRSTDLLPALSYDDSLMTRDAKLELVLVAIVALFASSLGVGVLSAAIPALRGSSFALVMGAGMAPTSCLLWVLRRMRKARDAGQFRALLADESA